MDPLSTDQVLTPPVPAVPNYCCSKDSVPYWSNQPLLIFDIRALSPERQNTRMSKIINGGLDQYGKCKALTRSAVDGLKTTRHENAMSFTSFS